MSGSEVFSPDFKEFVELLNRHEVKYLVTGKYVLRVRSIAKTLPASAPLFLY
jgi:hypothetical protein